MDLQYRYIYISLAVTLGANERNCRLYRAC